MPRTITRHWQEFKRPIVTYTFHQEEPKAHITIITVPPGSDWSSLLHWHETHREFLEIVQGTALVTVGSTTRSYTASDGVITVERGVLHEWQRDPDDKQVLVVEEWTDPADGEKELFFRNLCSSMLDLKVHKLQMGGLAGRLPLDWVDVLQIFVIFGAYDNYPVMYRGPLMKVSTRIVLFLTGWIGLALGFKAR